MKNNVVPRKNLKKILLVNWSRFTAETIKVSNSVLITGVNGTGKSTILDAVSYAICGNKNFNSAAQDKDRTVRSYVRGDTKGNAKRYLRNGAVVSYIALEFWSELENMHFVVGVCIESKNDMHDESFWFVKKNIHIEDINFYKKENNTITATVRGELMAKGEQMKGSEFVSGKNGVQQVMRALGLPKLDKNDYAQKLLKMMSFKPENNINDFIRQSVLKENPVSAIELIRESKQNHDRLQQTYENIMVQQRMLNELENLTTEYEQSRRKAEIKRFIGLYQNIQNLQIEKTLQQEALEKGKYRLEHLIAEKESAEKIVTDKNSALFRAQTEFNNSDFDGKLRSLHSEIDSLSQSLKEADNEITRIERLQANVNKLLDDSELNLTLGANSVIRRLSAPNINSDDKYSAMVEWRKLIRDSEHDYNKQIDEQETKLCEINNELSEIKNNIRKLEEGKSAFPSNIYIYI